MDKMELVNRLRTGAFLVSVVLRAQGKADDTIPDETRTKLASAQRDVRDTLVQRSMTFGDKRLVLNEDFVSIVQGMGQPMLDFQQLMATLPADKQDAFEIERKYEPVPAPDGFGLLPEAVTASLARHVEDRISKMYYAGLVDTAYRLKDAAEFFAERVTTYHNTAAAGTSRAVMREVVLTNLRDMRTLLSRVNITGNAALTEADTTLIGAVQYGADELRKSPEKRVTAIAAAKAGAECLAKYLGG